MVAHEGDLRWGQEGGQPGHEFHRRHHAVGAPAAGDLHPVGNLAIAQHLDPIERERGPRTVADEALAPLDIVAREAHRAVDVEPVAHRREAQLAPVEIGVSRVVRRSRRARQEGAAGEGELRAAVDRRGLGGLVAALVDRFTLRRRLDVALGDSLIHFKGLVEFERTPDALLQDF